MAPTKVPCVAPILLAVLALAPAGALARVVGCYFGSWAGYRSGDGTFTPENIDPNLCTHIYYAFAGISSSGGVEVMDDYNDLPSGKNFYAKVNAVKTKNPSVKTIISIGGYSEGSLDFSAVANNAGLRSAFAVNAANFAQQYGFDGVDIDWEFPADRGGAASDNTGLVEMLKALRTEMDKRGLLLTAAVNTDASRIGSGYNVAEISKYLDLINMMTYDFHGTWDSTTGHNSPLYASSADNTDYKRTLNADYSIRNWINNGAPANKMVIGMGTYGHSFTLASSSNTGMGAPVTGGGTPGRITNEAGTLAYYEVCSDSAWNVVWDNNIKAPYAYKGNQWVGYDNPESVKIKSQYAIDMGLAGGFIWSLENDDFRGICGQGTFPLLTTIRNTLNGAGTSTGTTTTTTTTAAPSVGSTCSSEGYVRDPTNCQVYYYCQADGQGGYIQYKFQCPDTLGYDTTLKTCNYKNQVSGC